MQFPWMMYCKGPGLALPNGQSVSCQVALDEAEYADALKAGWFPSVPEALAEKLAAPAPEPVKAPAEESVPDEVAPEVEESDEATKDEDESEPDEAPRRGRPQKS